MIGSESRRDQEQGGGAGLSQRFGQSFAGPGEIKSREVELGPHRKLENPLLQSVVPHSCIPDGVFVILLSTAVETAVSEVHTCCLIRTGGVPTSLTLLFWRWLTVYSVFTG